MESSIVECRLPLARELAGDQAEARKAVGYLIRAARRDAGMSAQQLADSLEPPVTVSTVTSWERGRTTPGPSARDQLEAVLKGQLEELRLRRVEVISSPLMGPELAAAWKDVADAMSGLSLEGLLRLAECAELLRYKYPAEGAGGGGGDAKGM